MKPTMIVSMLLVLLALPVSVATALADANCGNPCDDHEVWTDKFGGKCLPKPKPPGEAKTS